VIRALLTRPRPNPIHADDEAVLTALRRSPKTAAELCLATSRDERRVFAAVDRLVDDGRVAGGWVHSAQGTRWTYTTTTEETTP
jgi:hypothetical protein